MINALGVVAWGVGGIEAEAAMLGQPVYFLTPDVVGVHLKGRLREGVTATDLVLALTEMLRKAKVVGKFVEFFGEGAASLTVPDRATICNMAPEYGATIGFFAVDDRTVDYMAKTGRTPDEIGSIRRLFQGPGTLRYAAARMTIDYSQTLEFDLSSATSSLAGPKRPQDRVDLAEHEENIRYALLQADGGQRLQSAPRQTRQALSNQAPGCRNRQRRCAHRRDHVVYQYLESWRSARRGSARKEGGSRGPQSQIIMSRRRSLPDRAWSPST